MFSRNQYLEVTIDPATRLVTRVKEGYNERGAVFTPKGVEIYILTALISAYAVLPLEYEKGIKLHQTSDSLRFAVEKWYNAGEKFDNSEWQRALRRLIANGLLISYKAESHNLRLLELCTRDCDGFLNYAS